jgi:hypothetical protein
LFLKRKEFETPIVLMDAELFFTLVDCALDPNGYYDPVRKEKEGG